MAKTKSEREAEIQRQKELEEEQAAFTLSRKLRRSGPAPAVGSEAESSQQQGSLYGVTDNESPEDTDENQYESVRNPPKPERTQQQNALLFQRLQSSTTAKMGDNNSGKPSLSNSLKLKGEE